MLCSILIGVLVCVSDLMIAEIKHIIKDSEIMKYVLGHKPYMLLVNSEQRR